jgi:hypothetical protein
VLGLPVVFLLLQAVISVRTELMAVAVTVIDRRDRRVDGLTQRDFRVLKDGRLEQITVFHNGEAPITIGAKDDLFAIGFDDEVSLALADDRPFTHDATVVEP